MQSRIYRGAAALIAVLTVLILAETSQAYVAHLEAKPTLQRWVSPQKLSAERALRFAVYINGREVDQRGHVIGRCRFVLFTRRVSLELTNCGHGAFAPVIVRYMGTARFMLRYRLRGK